MLCVIVTVNYYCFSVFIGTASDSPSTSAGNSNQLCNSFGYLQVHGIASAHQLNAIIII